MDAPYSPALAGEARQRPPQASGAERLAWVDRAKGVGIILVVFGHVWRGLETAGLIGNAALFRVVDTLIYAFHMPFFFFLSGIFFHHLLVGRPAPAFVRSRILRLIWPLALWTWIYFLFKLAAGQLANAPLDWSDFPLLPLPPREQFWFLWALFLIQMAAVCARPVLARENLAAQGWAVLGALALLLYFTRPGLSELAPWTAGALIHAPYFVMGVIFGRARLTTIPARAGWVAIALFLMVEAIVVRLGSGGLGGPLLAAAGASLALSLALAALERWEHVDRALGWLRLLGTASMAVYVAHVIFGSGVRIGLAAAGVQNPWSHVVLGTLAGILGPLALFIAARRAGVARSVGF